MSNSELVAQTLNGSHFCPNCNCIIFPAPGYTCPFCNGELVHRFVSAFLTEEDIEELDHEFINFIGLHFGVRLSISVQALLLVEGDNPFIGLSVAAASAVASLPEIMILEGFGAGDEAFVHGVYG